MPTHHGDVGIILPLPSAKGASILRPSGYSPRIFPPFTEPPI